MTIESIMTVVTAFVTYIFGMLAKKFNWMESKYIPIQNFVIGCLVAVAYYFLVDSSNLSNAIVMAFSGLISGGFYDLMKTKKERGE